MKDETAKRSPKNMRTQGFLQVKGLGQNAEAQAANAAPGPNLPQSTTLKSKKNLVVERSQEFEIMKIGNHKTKITYYPDYSSNEKSTPANQTGCGIA